MAGVTADGGKSGVSVVRTLCTFRVFKQNEATHHVFPSKNNSNN